MASPVGTLQIEFSWLRYRANVTDQASHSEPIYTIDIRSFVTPQVVFKNTKYDLVFGTATLPLFSIDAGYELHGQQRTLNALNRLRTEYSHVSYNLSGDQAPIKMNWKNTIGAKTWDLVCMDENENMVARFTGHPWALNKWGKLEILHPAANSQAAREELLVTSFTLFMCLLSRTSGMLSVLGINITRSSSSSRKAIAKRTTISTDDEEDRVEADGKPVSELFGEPKERPSHAHELPGATPHHGHPQRSELP